MRFQFRVIRRTDDYVAQIVRTVGPREIVKREEDGFTDEEVATKRARELLAEYFADRSKRRSVRAERARNAQAVAMSVAQKISVHCYGGCGKSETLRKSKVRASDYFVCSCADCRSKLPPLMPGKIREFNMQAAGSFCGVRDIWPSAEQAARVLSARTTLAAAQTQEAINKARLR